MHLTLSPRCRSVYRTDPRNKGSLKTKRKRRLPLPFFCLWPLVVVQQLGSSADRYRSRDGAGCCSDGVVLGIAGVIRGSTGAVPNHPSGTAVRACEVASPNSSGSGARTHSVADHPTMHFVVGNTGRT